MEDRGQTDWVKKEGTGCHNDPGKGLPKLAKGGGGLRLRETEPDSSAVRELLGS